MQRQYLARQVFGIYGRIAAAGAAGYKTVSTYAGEETLVRSTSQGARNYDRTQERQLLADIRIASRESSQTVTSLLQATDYLVDASGNREHAAKLSNLLGRVATMTHPLHPP